MPTATFRSKIDGRIISFEHAEGLTNSQIQGIAKRKLVDDLNADDSFVVDVAKSIGAGGVKAVLNTLAGAQQTIGTAIGDEEENAFVDALFSNAAELRQMADDFDEVIGLDDEFKNSFGGQVFQGLGQMPVQIGASIAGAVGGTLVAGPGAGTIGGALLLGGGTAAFQMQTEAVRDAEQSIGKKYADFSDKEKRQTAASSLGYMTIGGAMEYFAAGKLVPTPLKRQIAGFVRGKNSLPSGTVKQVAKSLKREAAEGFLVEGMTESAQGQLLDILAKASYDDDRSFISMQQLSDRFNEFLIGGIVGGTTSATLGSVQRAATGESLIGKKETKAIPEAELEGKQRFTIEYSTVREPVDGPPVTTKKTQVIVADSVEEANTIASEFIKNEPTADKDNYAVTTTTTVTPMEEAKPDEEAFTLTPDDFKDEPVVGAAAPEVRELQFTEDDARKALQGKLKGQYDYHKDSPIARGAVRLNLNSKFYKKDGEFVKYTSDQERAGLPRQEGATGPLFVQTLHPVKKSGAPDYGKAHSYGRAFTLKNATFSVNPFAKKIIRSKAENKYPMASVDGDVVDAEPNLEGEILSFNPFRDDTFVDSKGRVVVGADEVTVYGTKAYARGDIKYADAPTDVVTASEILKLAKSGKKYTHPKFHPQGISLGNLAPDQIQKLEALAQEEGEPVAEVEPTAEVGDGPLTEDQVEQGAESEQGVVIDIDVDGDTIADSPVVGAARPVSVPNAPVVSRKSLRGKKGFIYFSDRTRIGTYTGLDPDSGISIPLQGGMGYPFIPKNNKANAGWAFTTDAIFKKFAIKVDETDGIGYVALYTKENLRANETFLLAYVAEVEHAIKTKKISLKDFLVRVNKAREQVLNLSSVSKETGKRTYLVKRNGKGFPLFSKPFKSIAAFKKAMQLAGFEVRGKMLEAKTKEITKGGVRIKVPGELSGGRLANKTNVKAGMPDVIQMIDLFTEPDLANRERGEIVGAVQFEKGQVKALRSDDIGAEEHLSYPLVIKGKGIGVFDETTNVLDVIKTDKAKNEALRSAETSFPEAAVGAARQETTDPNLPIIAEAVNNLETAAKKIGVGTRVNTSIDRPAQYNYETGTIEYNPDILSQGTKERANAILREEVIHASMGKVLSSRAKGKSKRKAFEDFMTSVGKSMTPEQRAAIEEVYGERFDDLSAGAEYTRFMVQAALDGRTTESFMRTGKAFDKVKSLIKQTQAYLSRVLGKDIEQNREFAEVIADTFRLLQSVDPEARAVNQKVVEQAMSIASGQESLSSANISDPMPDLRPYKKREKERKTRAAKRTARKFLQPASDFFGSIHPEIQRILSGYFTNVDSLQLKYAKRVRSFQMKLSGIKNKSDKLELDRLLSYNPSIEESGTPESLRLIQRREDLLVKYGLFNEFNLNVRPVLDELFQAAKDSGLDINYIEGYFPRRIQDLEGLKNLYGQEVSKDFESHIDLMNQQRERDNERPMTQDEIALEFHEYITKKKFVQPSRIPANLKQRQSSLIESKAMQFYYPAEESLAGYIGNIVLATETQKLLGKALNQKTKQSTRDGQNVEVINISDLTGELNAKVAELLQRGELNKEKMESFEYGLTQLFGSQNGSENDMLAMLRTFNYGTLLAEPTSTLSQLYDLSFQVMDTGILPVLSSLAGRKITMESLGLDPNQISNEFQLGDSTKSQFLKKSVDLTLTATGFRRMDQLLKETNLTANYKNFRRVARMAKNSSRYKKMRSELEFMVGEDADLAMQLFKDGKHSHQLVREILVRRLLETQPLNRFEMPLAVSAHPNARMLYVMKSFVVKQVSTIFRRYVSTIFDSNSSKREKARALGDLAKLFMAFALVGFPTDFLKDLLAGRDVYAGDYLTNSTMRVFGFSRYNLYELRKEGAGTVLKNYFFPVGLDQTFTIGNEIGKVIAGDEITDTKLVPYLPFSDLWYYRYGPGIEKQQRVRTRKLKEGILPTLDF